MDDTERKGLAAEMIAAALDRLKKQAVVNDLPHLAELIEVARMEARSLSGAEQ